VVEVDVDVHAPLAGVRRVETSVCVEVMALRYRYVLHADEGDDERSPAAAAVVVVAAFGGRSADHSWACQDIRHIGEAVPLAGGWVPDDVGAEHSPGVEGAVVVEDGVAVAAVERMAPAMVGVGRAEGRGGDEAGKLAVARVVEEAEHGGRWVQRAVAAGEGGVGDDAAPALADGGGPDEPRRIVRRKAEEDFRNEIVRQSPRRRRHWRNRLAIQGGTSRRM